MKKKLFLFEKLNTQILKMSLKSKFFRVAKKRNETKENNIGSIGRTLLSSIVIISIFSVTPIIVNFFENASLVSGGFENNSKNNLNKIFEKSETETDKIVNRKYLFEDILLFDETPTDSIRLSAVTIEELFKSTKYSLKDVRKNKLVKPISLTLLPSEIKKIENSKKRKDLFIQIILPLVIKENNNIKLDRKKLFSILNKSKNTRSEKNWLQVKFKQYGIKHKDLSTLKIRMMKSQSQWQ